MKSKIKSFEDACIYLGIPTDLPIVDNLPEDRRAKVIADYKLPIIIQARNQEANNGKPWQPKYDGSQSNYFPVIYRGDENGSGFRFFRSVFIRRFSTVGSRLEFESDALCEATFNDFIDLYRDAQMIPAEVPTSAVSE